MRRVIWARDRIRTRSIEVVFSELTPLSRRTDIVRRIEGHHTEASGGVAKVAPSASRMWLGDPAFESFHEGTRHAPPEGSRSPRPRERRCAEMEKITEASNRPGPDGGDGEAGEATGQTGLSPHHVLPSTIAPSIIQWSPVRNEPTLGGPDVGSSMW